MLKLPFHIGSYTNQLALAAPLAAIFLLWGCPGELENPERFTNASTGTSGCINIETELFPQRCADTNCHNATDQLGDLDLVSPGVVNRLVGVDSTAAMCNGMALVRPGDPENSVLYNKLTEDFCAGTRMPITGDKLDDDELACVADWINALPSGSGGGASSGGGEAGMGGAGGAGMGRAGGAGMGGGGGS